MQHTCHVHAVQKKTEDLSHPNPSLAEEVRQLRLELKASGSTATHVSSTSKQNLEVCVPFGGHLSECLSLCLCVHLCWCLSVCCDSRCRSSFRHAGYSRCAVQLILSVYCECMQGGTDKIKASYDAESAGTPSADAESAQSASDGQVCAQSRGSQGLPPVHLLHEIGRGSSQGRSSAQPKGPCWKAGAWQSP